MKSGAQRKRRCKVRKVSKASLEQARQDLDSARRASDLARMSELQYGIIPELRKAIRYGWSSRNAGHEAIT